MRFEGPVLLKHLFYSQEMPAEGLGFRVQGSGFRDYGVYGLGILGFRDDRVQGIGFRI